MRATSIFVAALAASLLSNVCRAQDTNAGSPFIIPATKLESFETNIGIVIIKATTEVGTVSANTGSVSIKCRENTDTGSGRKESGIAIEIFQRGQGKDRILIDNDELNPLLKGLDYLAKLDPSVTSLDTFDAGYNTKGGFRIAALGNRRTGSIQFAVRDVRINMSPVLFSRQEMNQFSSLMDQAKKQLDGLGQKQ